MATRQWRIPGAPGAGVGGAYVDLTNNGAEWRVPSGGYVNEEAAAGGGGAKQPIFGRDDGMAAVIFGGLVVR